jgi:MFS family permease
MTPPGKTRNAILGFFAASPPIGAAIGGLLAGVFIEKLDHKWLFVLL